MFTFFTSDPCDLEFKPSESKINIGHVLNKTNQHVKYDSSVITSSKENEWKQCFYKNDS